MWMNFIALWYLTTVLCQNQAKPESARAESGLHPILPDPILPGQNRVKLSQLVGGAGKNSFSGVFWSVFCPVLCFFTNYMYMIWIFWEKIGPSLLFLAAGTTDTKVRRSTGVTTANSTNRNPNANKSSWAINRSVKTLRQPIESRSVGQKMAELWNV